MKSKYKLGVSYFGNRFLKHAKEDLAEIAECCTYVVHTCSEIDFYFHKIALENIFKETRKRKLQVWVDPWGLGGVFGGESFSKFLLDHRRSWQFLSTGEAVQAACLNNPQFRGFVKEWITLVSGMGAEVVLWDEPHIFLTLEAELSKEYSCVCPICEELYMKKYAEKMPRFRTPQAHEFRIATMRDFLQDMLNFAKKKGLINALTIYAFRGIKEYDRLWKEAGTLKNLDIFGCDPYWRWHAKVNPVSHVREFAIRVVETCRINNLEPHLWIQAMKLPKGSEHEISKAIQAAAASGVRNLAAWSYDGGELLDPTYAEDSRKVWQTVKKTYLKLQKTELQD